MTTSLTDFVETDLNREREDREKKWKRKEIKKIN